MSEGPASTGIMLSIDAAPEVRGQAEVVRVQVRSGPAALLPESWPLRGDEILPVERWPVDLALRTHDATRGFSATAWALDASGAPVAQALLHGTFKPGAVQRFALHLVACESCVEPSNEPIIPGDLAAPPSRGEPGDGGTPLAPFDGASAPLPEYEPNAHDAGTLNGSLDAATLAPDGASPAGGDAGSHDDNHADGCGANGSIICAESCVDTSNHELHCGGCGVACEVDALCIASSCQHNPSGSGCEPRSYGGRAYALCKDSADWFEARDKCLAKGMDLAIIEDDGENAALASPLFVWIGLGDDDDEGTFRRINPGSSVDTKGAPATYLPWAAGEPTNFAICQESFGIKLCGADEDAVVRYSDGSFGAEAWETRLPYLCEAY